MAKSEFLENEIKSGLPAAADVAQDDLFDILTTGNAAAAMPFKARAAAVERGRGRPSGSPNKRTLALAQYLMSKYRNPVEVAAAAYSMTPVELLEDLGFKLKGLKPMQYNDLIMWAVGFQMQCAAVVRQYVVSPMPTTAPTAGGGMMPLQVNIGLGSAPAKDVSGCTHTAGGAENAANPGGGGAAIDAIFSQMSQENQSEIK